MTGLYLEQLEVGRVFEHPIRRTVTEADNVLFSCLTHNPQPLHIDREFAKNSEWTLGTTVGNLGMTEVKFPKPVFHGDTLHVTTEIVSKRNSRTHKNAGIVEFLHRAYNQRGELVAECRRQAMMRKKPQGKACCARWTSASWPRAPAPAPMR
jgi:acyl dehydratase